MRFFSPSRCARAASRTLSALILSAALGCASGGQPVSPPPPPPPPAPPPPANPWTLVWADEFSAAAGSGVDAASWRHDSADGCPDVCGWGNQEREYYTTAPENIAHTGDGSLAIVARVATDSLSCYYGRCGYTSAKIHTRDKVSVRPGRVEARIKLATGQGLWPAFWMLGENIATVGWPASGELDILENKGSQPTLTSSAVHGPGYSGNTPFAHATATTATDFHVYAVEWDPESIRYYVDNRLHYSVSRAQVQQYGAWVFDQAFYIVLNQAVGGHFDGNPQSNSIFPATMLIDYVRVYRKT